MFGKRYLGGAGRLMVGRWTVLDLLFNGQRQQINQCLDRKGLIDNLLDAAADGLSGFKVFVFASAD